MKIVSTKIRAGKESILRFSEVGGVGDLSPFDSGRGEASWKFSAVLVMIEPPAADLSSSHSLGGGSFPKKFEISYAL